MNLEKVIFDTNILFNKKASSFFGNRADLENFSKRAELFIPDMVIGELEEKYRRLFENEKGKFLKTVLDSFLNHDAETVNIIDEIEKLKSKETIGYTILELTDYSVLKEIKDLALKKEPPFESKDDNDKGFKDAYIYFTILEFLKNIDDKYIFVCTNDFLLTKTLEKHSNIKVVKNFEEFKNESISIFYDNYFIKKLEEKLNYPFITKDNIIDYWININGNNIILVKIENDEFVVEVESGEIIDFANKNQYDIFNLINSGSYAWTHSAVAELESFKQYFSDDDIIKILEATVINSQIIPDEDVRQFINDIYQPKKDIIDDKLKNQIEEFLK